ncbi:FIST signal transduction protein [Zhongshania sp.]|uniref:FIST signal transduction protein n=1 Tax=Zhongshania sp. TaxID=1971902 RepID=UPI00356205ED
MKSELFSWHTEWGRGSDLSDASLVIYFAAPTVIRGHNVSDILRKRYPLARQIGCSSGGEIHDAGVIEDSISGVALSFDRAEFKIVSASANSGEDYHIGVELASQLLRDDLKWVFVLSDGLNVNGSDLVRGLSEALPNNVLLTGGLAGGSPGFGESFVGLDEPPQALRIGALGVYGSGLHCSSGSMGGWQVFGPPRQITRAEGNILYELDGAPALDLYKHYLGAEAAELPTSALLYPLAIWAPGQTKQDVVRTIVGVDEASKSLIFTGDVPVGYSAKLMSASFAQLARGAEQSAEQARVNKNGKESVAILVSCIGRKLLMGQMVADEIEAVKDVLPQATKITGFYSYGEIAPHGYTGNCQLHNQTMTITTIWED